MQRPGTVAASRNRCERLPAFLPTHPGTTRTPRPGPTQLAGVGQPLPDERLGQAAIAGDTGDHSLLGSSATGQVARTGGHVGGGNGGRRRVETLMITPFG